MEEGRSIRNRVDCGLENKINTLLNKFYLKREVLCKKLNGVNYRRLMKQYFDIINGFKQTIIKMSKSVVIDEEIYLLTNK